MRLISYFRHIIFAPAKTNQYAASGFPAIGDAIYLGDTTEIKNQIAIATYFIKSASTVLKEFNKFIFAWLKIYSYWQF